MRILENGKNNVGVQALQLQPKDEIVNVGTVERCTYTDSTVTVFINNAISRAQLVVSFRIEEVIFINK